MTNRKISIEYCTGWGYLPKALDMAEKILGKYKNEVTALTLIPSSGGVFEVTSNDQLIFSKKQEGRFPEFNELDSKI